MKYEVEEIAEHVLKGYSVVMRTDTVYGILAEAKNPDAVERLYKLKKRNTGKPCIVLVSKVEELSKFGVIVEDRYKVLLKTIWPAPISVVFSLKSGLAEKYEYLHRGVGSIAFRIPNNDLLIDLLKITGPLVAPSANIEGDKPVSDFDEAIEVFGDYEEVMVVDGGKVYDSEMPSKVITFDGNGKIMVIRS